MEAYETYWKSCKEKIDNILVRLNEECIGTIADFAKGAYAAQASRSHTLAWSSFSRSPYPELPTGLILAGMNHTDNTVLFDKIASTLSTGSSHRVAMLRNLDCGDLKGTLKKMIEGFMQTESAEDEEDEEAQNEGVLHVKIKGSKPAPYDIRVLEGWYKHASRGKQPGDMNLVVIVPEFERFEPKVFQDFVQICSARKHQLPIVLLLGLATTLDAVHQTLHKTTLSLLQCEKFHLVNSDACIDSIVDEVFLRPKDGCKLSSPVLSLLLSDGFKCSHRSIAGVVAGMQYATMAHFYANPFAHFSVLNPKSEAFLKAAKDLGPEALNWLRACGSLQRAIDSNVIPPRKSLRILTDDSYLSTSLPLFTSEIHTHHSTLRLALLCIQRLESHLGTREPSLRSLYLMWLRSGTSLSSSSSASRKSTVLEEPYIRDLIRRLRGLEEDSKGLKVLKGVVRCWVTLISEFLSEGGERGEWVEGVNGLEGVVEDWEREEMGSEDEEGEGEGGDDKLKGNEGEEEEFHLTKRSLSGAGSLGNTAFKRSLELLRKEQMKAARQRRSKVSSVLKPIEEAEEEEGTWGWVLGKVVKEFFEGFLGKALRSHHTIPFSEMFYFSDWKLLKKHLMPQPRAATQFALNSSYHYLGCTCCVSPLSSSTTSPSKKKLKYHHKNFEDTSIVYRLHMECGQLVNLYDLFVAFESIVSSEKKQDQEEEEEEEGGEGEGRKDVQARFFKSVTELTFMGFLKATGRKTDHVMRLTFGTV
ncbi:Origin recognition complex subunit 3 [Chytridiales sp. JEL 0842]|nr:Origin recognition complex subunit 3 [Chytridiales sp. JEL 0842]